LLARSLAQFLAQMKALVWLPTWTRIQLGLLLLFGRQFGKTNVGNFAIIIIFIIG